MADTAARPLASATPTAFGPYDGPRTGAWVRALVIPRYGYRDVARSKLALMLLVVGCVMPALAMAIIYARHNASVIELFGPSIVPELELANDFFISLLYIQVWISFYIALWIGPPLIGRDTRDNALPLYLARPISPGGYVAGKLAVLLGPLSFVTWGLGGLVIAFQLAFEGRPWLRDHMRDVGAFFIGAWVFILPLALATLALSVLFRRTWMARGALFGGLIVLRGVGAVINEIFQTGWGDLIAPTAAYQTILSDLFDHTSWFGVFDNSPRIPVWSAWLVLGLICAACVVILARRVRAYEVVS